jgi:DNA-binding response OmpR family regulator
MDTPKKKILIIEDDMMLQTVYKQKFEESGMEVFQAINGNLGMTLAKDKLPDIILLDIMLPQGMNGFDVMEQLRQDSQLTKVPVIVLTNLDSEKDTAMSIGAVDYVVKANTSIDDLVGKVLRQLSK